MSQFKARLMFVVIILVIGGTAVALRLFTIQVIDSKRYVERSRNQTQQRRMVPATRGNILDRQGTILATSMESSLNIKQEGLGRVYPFGDDAGPLLGYTGKDAYGLGGIEFSYDNYLRGEDGWIILQKDGRNKRYRKIGLPSREPRTGHDVYLTIDHHVQNIAQTVLKQTVTSLKAKGGMCIVMEPKSGKILAMANWPSFNPNHPAQYSLSQRQNKCISSIYEPGSTFKLVTTAAALQDNIKKENDIVYGNKGVFEIFKETIRDHVPYGYITFDNAFSYSSNVCIAKVATEVGSERLFRYTRDFGFGTRTGIDLPGEESGILHPVKSWSGRTCVTMAIGQEISVTLLQMLQPFATVANGGVLVSPRICEKIVDRSGLTVDSSTFRPVRRVLSENVALRLRMMLKNVVEQGTGKNAKLEGVSVAGKTGTSQKLDSGVYSKTMSWSSFIGFVPAEEPVLLCGIMIDEPENHEMGGVAAAPAFKKIMSQIISHPELAYTQEILKKNSIPVPKKKVVQDTIPSVCGMIKIQAQQRLDSIGIRYRFSGTGNKIVYQTPLAGGESDRSVDMVLFLDSSDKHTGSSTEIPQCVGKDLRDAVNMINLKGLKPFAIGSGTVHRQSPAGGAMMRIAETCTLFCSFGG